MLRVLGATVVNWSPSTTGLPGFSTLQTVTDTVGMFALLGCLLALIGGGVAWAAGSSSSNPAVAATGKKAVAGAIVGAIIIGAASYLINFFYTMGQGIHN